MQKLKTEFLVTAIFFVGCAAHLFGRGVYDSHFRSHVAEQDRIAGQYTSYSVPGEWPSFWLNLAIVAGGLAAIRYFGGWATASAVLVLCTLGAVEIDRIVQTSNSERSSAFGTDPLYYFSPDLGRFAIWGGLVSGSIAGAGVYLAGRCLERRRWNSRHLFVAMAAVACLFGGLEFYEWDCRESNRSDFARFGLWPAGWNVTDEDRRMHEEWIRRCEEEESKAGR